jgi:hypothetical protein
MKQQHHRIQNKVLSPTQIIGDYVQVLIRARVQVEVIDQVDSLVLPIRAQVADQSQYDNTR